MVDVVQKEREVTMQHLSKVFETLYSEVVKNRLPDEKRRARHKHRPKLFRKPGNFQEIIWSEIHRNSGRVLATLGDPHFEENGT